LGTKVDAIENALTFLHDNVQIELPKMNDTVLILSPEMVDETTRPIALAAIGGNEGDGNEGGIVGKIVNAYANTLRQERIMFAIFLGIWGFVVLMGLAVVFWHTLGKKWAHGIGRRHWERRQRSGIDGIVVPFRAGASESDPPATHLRSFSPLPPPQKPVPLDEEENWDSYFGQKKQSQPEPGKISRPMKLMAVARERLKSSDVESQRGPPRTTVFTRLFGSKPNPPSPKRQPLTINVERAISLSPPHQIQIEQHQEEDPVSAWSTSCRFYATTTRSCTPPPQFLQFHDPKRS
jgi:hypothetical protein